MAASSSLTSGQVASDNATIHQQEKDVGKRLTPFEAPLSTSKPLPPSPLTKEQDEKYNSLLSHFLRPDVTLPQNDPSALPAELNVSERIFLTKECLLRYLRATKWDVNAAQARLEATILWRRSYGVEQLTPEHIEPENLTGKQWIIGYDSLGRPCLSLNPARQNTDPSPRQIEHLVFMLERAIELMPPGQETIALLIDFAKSSSSKNPSISTGKQVLQILQNHYPERLGKAVCMNLPWFVWGFMKVIMPFVDPMTREKVAYDGQHTTYIPAAHLEKRFGGEVDFEYDHKTYWPALIKLCERRRAEYIERWHSLGGKIGTSEFLLRGGSEEIEI